MKRWVASHTKDNSGTATTVYFDAFESDYLSDPLISIITAISERIPENKVVTLNKWKTAATKLVKPALGVALSLATFGAKQQLEEMGDVIVDAVSSEGKAAISNLWQAEEERRDAILAFKSLLTELAGADGHPIVIVVDELDRCRPDYALSVLEVIKHFFSVPRVHFILGVNSRSLENSVKARYGAAVDAEGYLRKFINVSFSLPRFVGPNGNVHATISYASQMSLKMELPEKISARCIELLKHVVQSNEVSLRDVGKILSKIALVPSEASEKNILSGYIDILCVLLVSSVVSPKFHKDFIASKASFDSIMEFLGATKAITTESYGENYNDAYQHSITFWLVEVVYCCCPEALQKEEHLPSWKSDIGSQFTSFGLPRNSKGIPAMIQKDWVDLFNL